MSASHGKPIKVPDPSVDADRIYRPHVVTRSRKREFLGIVEELRKFEARTDTDDDRLLMAEEDEERGMRLVCDAINVMFEAGEDSPPPGDLLFDQWMGDVIPESVIADRFEAASDLLTDPT